MNTVPLTRNNQSYTMSSSRNTASSAPVNNAARPYCKVCHDAGRPEKEYTSHYVKDQTGPQGKVICPTLLNQSCRICNKTGHTSSYCPQYRRREEPRREERYIEREPRDYRGDDRRREEPRRDYREEPRREERYIERDPRDYREEPRREERNSFNRLREDTERHEREIYERDQKYHREQDRLAKPWLQAALKPATESHRREPYAHPHGPRVRLVIEAPALSASKHAAAAAEPAPAAIDIRNVTLNHASKWGDEDNEEPFVYNPEAMSREFLQQCIMSGLTTNEEHEFIAACDNQSEMPFFCGQ